MGRALLDDGLEHPFEGWLGLLRMLSRALEVTRAKAPGQVKQLTRDRRDCRCEARVEAQLGDDVRYVRLNGSGRHGEKATQLCVGAPVHGPAERSNGTGSLWR